MVESNESGPLSTEAEVVRVREHYHALNEKVGMIAVATAVNTTKLESLGKDVTDIKLVTSETFSLLKPLIETVGTLRLIVFGAIALVLSGVAYAVLATVVKAAR